MDQSVLIEFIAEVVELGDQEIRLVLPDGSGSHISKITSQTAKALQLLDGTRSWNDIKNHIENVSDELFFMLYDAGLLQETKQIPKFKVRLYGTGLLAQKIANTLTYIGVVELTIVPPTTNLAQHTADFQRAKFTKLTNVKFDYSWPLADRREVDLAIIASQTIEPDRGFYEDLLRNRVPTLIICAHKGNASIGPFYDEDSKACLKCKDLAHCEIDATWPVVLHKLSYRQANPRETAANWAAATAMNYIFYWLKEDINPLEATIVYWNDFKGEMGSLSWSVHDKCSCKLDNIA